MACGSPWTAPGAHCWRRLVGHLHGTHRRCLPGHGRSRFSFVLVRFLLGAGEAIIFPASNQFISRWIPTQERGIANGVIFAGVGAGAGSAPAMVTYIMVHYGWRWSFWLSALIGLLVGLVWFLAARDTPETHPSVRPPELLHIQTGRGAGRAATPAANARLLPWSAILSSKEVWLVTLSYFCFGYVAWIFFSWFYIYLAKVRGLDLKASAFYSTFPPLAMVACSLLGGVINDKLTKSRGKRAGRCGIAVFALALAAALLVIGSQAASGASRQPRPCGWRRGSLPRTEQLLVRDRRYLGSQGWFRFRVHEHGGATGRRPDGFADTRHRPAFWLDVSLPGRCDPKRSGCCCVALPSIRRRRWVTLDRSRTKSRLHL